MISKLKMRDKKGGVVTSTVLGVGGLIIGVIITLVIIQTLTDADLLTDATLPSTTVGNMTGNFTEGLDNISSKIPTILLLIAVVFLFGALVLLVQQSKRMGIGGGGDSL